MCPGQQRAKRGNSRTSHKIEWVASLRTGSTKTSAFLPIPRAAAAPEAGTAKLRLTAGTMLNAVKRRGQHGITLTPMSICINSHTKGARNIPPPGMTRAIQAHAGHGDHRAMVAEFFAARFLAMPCH